MWREELLKADRIAFDIESQPWECVGFAASPDRAYVFPMQREAEIREILASPARKIAANGMFDVTWLRDRKGIEVNNFTDDVQIAWHACYPELAGAKQDKRKGHKVTRKSLAFLSSMFLNDAWWKGDYENETEFYVYNGKDCCITYDLMVNHLDPLIDELGVRGIYEHEMGLVPVVVSALIRGIPVNERLRLERFTLLDNRMQEATKRLQELVIPLLDRLPEKRLFEQVEGVCKCCRHAGTKQRACWSCAGFSKAPSKADLVARGGDPKAKKEVLEAEMLGVCKACNGEPRRQWLEFNPSSVDQVKLILHDALKLPKRYDKGKVTVSEDALKSLLAVVSA